jgi:putative hemolysin
MAISEVKNDRQPDAVLTAEENLFTVEMALLVIVETGRDVREEEQLNSCFIMSVGHKKVTQLANPTDQVEKSLESKLCHIVPAKSSSVMYNVMYDEVYGVMYAEMYDEMCSNVFDRERDPEYNICKPVYIQQLYNEMRSTVFNRECRAEYNIYKTAYSQQIHTYTIAMEQCRDVDEQVGIAMTHLSYCWDSGKQMQIVVCVVQYDAYFNTSMQCRVVEEQVGITMTHLAYCWDSGKQMQIVVRAQGMFIKAT